MVKFDAHPECTRCEMHEEAHSVGIPMEWEPLSISPDRYKFLDTPNVVHRPPAVIVVGQNPGYNEDKEGRNFVIASFSGKPSAGKTLRESYLTGVDLFSVCSVYYVNAARCGPRSTTKVGVYNACIEYLWADINAVSLNHARIALLFVSAPALKAFHKRATGETMTQKKSLTEQGRELHIDGVIVGLFSTYHPAWINRGNFRALHRVDSHMRALLRWVTGDQPEPVPLNLVSKAPPNEVQNLQ